jgi:hypothetical protein
MNGVASYLGIALAAVATCHPPPSPAVNVPGGASGASRNAAADDGSSTASAPTTNCGLVDRFERPAEEWVQRSFVDDRGLLRSAVATSPGTERWGTCDHDDVLTLRTPRDRDHPFRAIMITRFAAS